MLQRTQCASSSFLSDAIIYNHKLMLDLDKEKHKIRQNRLRSSSNLFLNEFRFRREASNKRRQWHAFDQQTRTIFRKNFQKEKTIRLPPIRQQKKTATAPENAKRLVTIEECTNSFIENLPVLVEIKTNDKVYQAFNQKKLMNQFIDKEKRRNLAHQSKAIDDDRYSVLLTSLSMDRSRTNTPSSKVNEKK
ncbi:hypothetical protein SNEBB_000571 [Seison nebaliae]|nr:hypothetical protein SNEBB_000571 [Seison nebaliae]